MKQSIAFGAAAEGEFARRDVAGRDRAGVVAGFVVYLAVLAAGWAAVCALVPDHLSLHLFGRAVDVKAVHHRIFENAMMAALMLPSALCLEAAIVGWRRSSLRALVVRPSASMKTDLAYFALGQPHLTDLLGKLMTLGVSMLSGLWLKDWLSRSLGVAVDPASLPIAAQVVAYVFAYTFFDYWTHRLDHSRYFWPLHRYHHAAEDFCIATATRAHPAAFTGVFLINMPMAALGAPVQVLVDVNLLTIALGFLIHSRIDSDFGWIGRYLVQSPNHHRLHHKLDMSAPTGHFGMAPIWDHLFGTWRGEADASLRIGVDTPYRHGVWIAPDLLRDYWDFWKGLAAGLRQSIGAAAPPATDGCPRPPAGV